MCKEPLKWGPSTTALGYLNCAWKRFQEVPEERGENKRSTDPCRVWSSFRRSPSPGSLKSRNTFLGVETLEAFSSLSLFATENIIFNCALQGRLPLTVKQTDRAGIIALPSRDDVFLFFPYFRARWVFVAALIFLQLWRAGAAPWLWCAGVSPRYLLLFWNTGSRVQA